MSRIPMNAYALILQSPQFSAPHGNGLGGGCEIVPACRYGGCPPQKNLYGIGGNLEVGSNTRRWCSKEMTLRASITFRKGMMWSLMFTRNTS